MPKNTGHGSRRERDGKSLGVFAEQRERGGNLPRVDVTFTPSPPEILLESPARDERGHQWATILGAKPTDTRFPLVCSQCMCRDDSVWAEDECDG